MAIEPKFPKSFPSDFEAVEFIKTWIGLFSWNEASEVMSQEACPVCFAEHAGNMGITRAGWQPWFDLYHGGGAWEKSFEPALRTHRASTERQGKKAFRTMMETGAEAIKYVGPDLLKESFWQGFEDEKRRRAN